MRRFLIIVLILAAAGGGGWYWKRNRDAAAVEAAAATARVNIVPILAVPARLADVPIFLDGLGTAQASANVTIKSQVDGKLIEVNFTEGQDVVAGTVLARIDPRAYQAALDQAVAKKAQDAATLANARIDMARYQKLAATAYTSAQQADTQKSLVAQLDAQVAGDQAQIDTARVNLGYTTITAPISGRIGLRQVDLGNIVHASDATGICTITTLQPIDMVFTLAQQYLPAINAAMAQGSAEVLALPQDGSGRVLDRGMLKVIDNQVDPATGTIKLKARFANPELRLWPGAFANVRVKVETRKDAIVVPPAAILRGPTGAYVYVVKDDNTAARRNVTVSHEDLQVAIVTDGLKAGEVVVTDGSSRLYEGSKVAVGDPSAPAAPTTGPVARQRTRKSS